MWCPRISQAVRRDWNANREPILGFDKVWCRTQRREYNAAMIPRTALGADVRLIDASRPYTHRLFVDFSGDDGRPGNGNSSEVISMAWVLSADSDIRHNEDVVLEMKRKLGCHPRDELKYKGIKRQERRKRASILGELANARVKVLSLVVLKRAIQEEVLRDPKTKLLLQFIHHFPVTRFFDTGAIPPEPEARFQMVFDQVSWTGCQAEIRRLFANDSGILWDAERDTGSLLFGNSRSILMLQMADVFAGMMRDYFESLPVARPRCRACMGKRCGDCGWLRGGIPVGNMRLLRLGYNHFLSFQDNGRKLDVGVLVRPPEAQLDYQFVDCLCSGRGK